MTTVTGSVPTVGAATAPTRAEARVIWLLLAAAFSVILNETVMGVAVPRLVADLGITLTQAQWLTTAFMLTMAVVIPVTGYLMQRLTTRQVFATAMSLFSAGTAVAIVAPGFEVLVVARVVQAAGTAMMMPLLMTTIMTLVPADQRGRFMGRITIVMAVAPALGPTVSGLILSVLGWRFLFVLVLPISLVMLVVGLRFLRNVGQTRRTPLDLPSVVLSALAFGGLVYGLSLVGGSDAARTTQMWAALAVGVVAMALFVARQLVLQRDDRALLDLRTFRSGQFALAVVMIVLMMAAQFGAIMLIPIYLQDVLGVEPVTAGLLMLPGGLAMGLLAPLVGRLFDRFGPRPLVVPGAAVVSGSLWMLTLVDAHTPLWLVLAAHVTMSVGLAFTFTPLMTSALGSLPPTLYSHGSAILGAVQQVAGAAGTALFITVTAARAAASALGDPVAAQAEGVAFAFLVGAAVSLLGVAGALFVRGRTR